MYRQLHVRKYLFALIISILTLSLLLPGCGGGKVVDEEEEELPIVPMHPSFSFSDLVIEPVRVICGEEVAITVSITNIGENQERYDSILNINGVEEEIKSITLDPGITGILTYYVVRGVAGTYDVEMSGLTGSFIVEPDEEVISEDDTSEDDTSEEVTTEIPEQGEISRSGWIYENETWSGTVHITGDTFVHHEATITILPGTKVLFAAHQDDQSYGTVNPPDEWVAQNEDPTNTDEYAQSHSKLDVYGALISRGTSENRIEFTSDSPTPDGADWQHLHVGYRSIIEYCIIEYSRAGLDVAEGTEDSVIVSNNIMRHNLWTGLTIHDSSPSVTNNEIWHSGGHQGIAIIGQSSSPYIAYNVIRECLAGINVTELTAGAVIEYNTLIDNDSGIGVSGPDTNAIIRYNSISSPNGPGQNWTYLGKPVYFSSILLGRDDAISGISVTDCSPMITNNSISQCNSTGINIMGNSSPTITRNTITDCHTGFLLDESFTGSPNIEENNIYNNSYSHISLWSEQSVSVTNNWWGTTDLSEIQMKILDMGGKPALGMVAFEPFLTQPVEME